METGSREKSSKHTSNFCNNFIIFSRTCKMLSQLQKHLLHIQTLYRYTGKPTRACFFNFYPICISSEVQKFLLINGLLKIYIINVKLCLAFMCSVLTICSEHESGLIQGDQSPNFGVIWLSPFRETMPWLLCDQQPGARTSPYQRNFLHLQLSGAAVLMGPAWRPLSLWHQKLIVVDKFHKSHNGHFGRIWPLPDTCWRVHRILCLWRGTPSFSSRTIMACPIAMWLNKKTTKHLTQLHWKEYVVVIIKNVFIIFLVAVFHGTFSQDLI